MSARVLLTAALAAAGIAAGAAGCACAATGEGEHAGYAVIIVIDGARPEYLEQAEIPNIRSLAQAGVSYDQAWVGHLVNNTPPGHAVIATGCFPKRTGVPHFSWRNPGTGKMMSVTREPKVSNGKLRDWMREAGCPMVADFVKKRYPDCKTAAVGSAKYYAVASLGGASADYVLYAARTRAGAEHGTTAETGPKVSYGPRGQMAPEAVLASVAKLADVGGDDLTPDRWAGEAAVALVKEVKPRLLMVNFPQTDHVGHACGGVTDLERMRRVIANVDVQIGRIIQAYRDLGIYEDTVFVVTSDHGMLPNRHGLRTAELAQIAELVGAKPPPAAGSPWVWIDNPETAQALGKALVRNEAPLVLAAYRKVKRDGAYRYLHVADLGLPEEVKEAQLYLLSTFASAASPDLGVFWAEDTVPLKPKDEARPGSRGNHINATWGTQAIPLIISGAGIAKGQTSDSPARLVDVGPTVLAAMGIEPQGLDGMVLADALAAPTGAQVEEQRARSTELARYRDALRRQSRRDRVLADLAD